MLLEPLSLFVVFVEGVYMDCKMQIVEMLMSDVEQLGIVCPNLSSSYAAMDEYVQLCRKCVLCCTDLCFLE